MNNTIENNNFRSVSLRKKTFEKLNAYRHKKKLKSIQDTIDFLLRSKKVK